MADHQKPCTGCDEKIKMLAQAAAVIDKQHQKLVELTLMERAGELHKRMLERRNDALKLVLMFYKGGIWSDEDDAKWKRITGSDDATTKVLCDHIRRLVTIGGQYLKFVSTDQKEKP